MQNNPKVSSKVAELVKLRAERPRDGKLVVTPEMRERWAEQEPSDLQVQKLQSFKLDGKRLVTDEEIISMSKLEASERIDEIKSMYAERDAQPMPSEWIISLGKFGYSPEEVAGLTRGEAKELFRALVPKSKPKLTDSVANKPMLVTRDEAKKPAAKSRNRKAK